MHNFDKSDPLHKITLWSKIYKKIKVFQYFQTEYEIDDEKLEKLKNLWDSNEELISELIKATCKKRKDEK